MKNYLNVEIKGTSNRYVEKITIKLGKKIYYIETDESKADALIITSDNELKVLDTIILKSGKQEVWIQSGNI